jgi:hypothetical protein
LIGRLAHENSSLFEKLSVILSTLCTIHLRLASPGYELEPGLRGSSQKVAE